MPASGVWRRARTAWAEAGLKPIGLHEARHSFASLMIAAGVNAKALSTYLGHASIALTYDRYGHLMPGNEREAAALLDGYLTRADTGYTPRAARVRARAFARTNSFRLRAGALCGWGVGVAAAEALPTHWTLVLHAVSSTEARLSGDVECTTEQLPFGTSDMG